MKGIIMLAQSLLMNEEVAAFTIKGMSQSSLMHFKALLSSKMTVARGTQKHVIKLASFC